LHEYKIPFEGPVSENHRIAFQIFLLFLYTEVITKENLKEHAFHLWDFATHFEVNKLKDYCVQSIYTNLTHETTEQVHKCIARRDDPALRMILSGCEFS
jgi:hypothetical protein